MANPEILYCHCAHADVVPAATKRELLGALCAAGAAFDAMPDLCGRAVTAAIAGGPGAELGAYTRIAACYPRAVRWLLDRAGVERADTQVINLRETNASVAAAALGLPVAASAPDAAAERGAEIASLLEQGHAVRVRPDGLEVGPAAGAWVPWFPVIDRERCTDCLKCLNFCLFGVFTRNADGSIEVAHPANCKTNCPACARVCPSSAIIFPKYKPGPLSGGPVDESEGGSAPVDIAALMQKDLYAALRGRRRFSTARDEETAAAEKCRCSCMDAIAKALDVPADVLASVRQPAPAPLEPEERRG